MNKIFRFKLTILVTILILIGILMPGDSVPSVGIPGIDKVVHFGMFFTFTATFCLEYVMGYKKLPKIPYLVIGVACFAISTEIMQLFAANRSFDLKDFAVDMVGCIVAIGLWLSGMKWKNKK